MYVRIQSSSTIGIDAYIVDVELDVSRGLPGFTMVGLPDTAVKESRERVRSALINSGYEFPQKRMTLNLAPADVPKEGSAFDLPIAVALLTGSGIIPTAAVEETLILGELALNGTLRPIKGVLPIAIDAAKHGIKRLLVPTVNAKEAAVVESIDVIPMDTLQQAVQFLSGAQTIEPCTVDLQRLFSETSEHTIDFSEVKGQEHVKRALEIAAAGGHNLIMIGPPGSGKSMLAKRLPTILPPLTFDEALETTKIHSIHGILPPNQPLITNRPFRIPHHSTSDAGLIGGGRIPRPGEASLAHNGVLFLDELPEFSRNVLENLRQPLEDGVITISRVSGSLQFPCKMLMVAAMNPCLCGFYGDSRRSCKCHPNQIERYIAKLSGPLLDRIDIHVEVPSVSYDDLHAVSSGERSTVIRDRVIQARNRQLQRFSGQPLYCNAHMQSKQIKNYCTMDQTARDTLRSGLEKLGLSARAYDRIIKVARTIADLEGKDRIELTHITEAMQYRSLDRKLWLK